MTLSRLPVLLEIVRRICLLPLAGSVYEGGRIVTRYRDCSQPPSFPPLLKSFASSLSRRDCSINDLVTSIARVKFPRQTSQAVLKLRRSDSRSSLITARQVYHGAGMFFFHPPRSRATTRVLKPGDLSNQILMANFVKHFSREHREALLDLQRDNDSDDDNNNKRKREKSRFSDSPLYFLVIIIPPKRIFFRIVAIRGNLPGKFQRHSSLFASERGFKLHTPTLRHCAYSTTQYLIPCLIQGLNANTIYFRFSLLSINDNSVRLFHYKYGTRWQSIYLRRKVVTNT